MGNPVRDKKWYREWLAWRLRALRVLDFQRIRDKVRSHHQVCPENCRSPSACVQERATAKSLFLTAENLPTALATTISTTVSTITSKSVVTTDEPRPAVPSGKAGRLMSKEDAEKVKKAIASATSVEEIRKLERNLREGYLPEMGSVGA